jgi:hypothetical protein
MQEKTRVCGIPPTAADPEFIFINLQMKYLFVLKIKLLIMKKILFLMLILGALVSTTTYAQAGDPPSVLQQMKEKQKPGLIEKAGLTDAQAEKVIELNYEMRMKASTELKDLTGEDRSKKLAEMKAAKEKKFAEFLSPEQITAMNKYYEEMGKNREKKN